MAVAVTVASVKDRDGARLLVNHLPGDCKNCGRFGMVAAILAVWWIDLRGASPPKQTKKFVLLPRRWVVERAFG
jgi:putative transposase